MAAALLLANSSTSSSRTEGFLSWSSRYEGGTPPQAPLPGWDGSVMRAVPVRVARSRLASLYLNRALHHSAGTDPAATPQPRAVLRPLPKRNAAPTL